MDLENPKHFTEKIQRFKLYGGTPLRTMLADKYAVRPWVEGKIGAGHLVPIYGAWDCFDEIDFGALPDRFVLKCNHGSGMNLIVKDKKALDMKKTRKQFEEWMAFNFAFGSVEMQYKDIQRKIIAERYIEEMDGALYDYKVHCFGGRPRFIQVIGERDLNKHTGCQRHYDVAWNDLGWTFEDYPRFPYGLPKPGCLDEMLRYARLLSDGFAYVRVDFYILDNQILFGEMTFTPASGYYPYKGSWTKELDLKLGGWIPA